MTEFCRSTLMPQLEARRSCQERACYRLHTHDRLSIGLIDSGTTVFTGAGGEPISLAGGDVIVIPAGHVHACNPDQGPWQYQMIHADHDWITTVVSAASGVLLGGISVFRHEDVYRRFNEANGLLFAGSDPDRIEAAFQRSFHFCTTLEPARRLAPATDPELFARLGPVLDRLRQDESNPMLDELAGIAGMGKYQLVRAMKRTTGLTPLAWRQNSRVTTARRMLREGCSLAETAQALGFVDQSHFHRVFRAHVAASPGTYRI